MTKEQKCLEYMIKANTSDLISGEVRNAYLAGHADASESLKGSAGVWVKASERLPAKGDWITWRWTDRKGSYSSYDVKRGFVFDAGGASVDTKFYSEIVWLDESQSTPSAPTQLAAGNQKLSDEIKHCNMCGGKLAEIRGRYPKTPDRLVCPTSATERLEQINVISTKEYGQACSANLSHGN